MALFKVFFSALFLCGLSMVASRHARAAVSLPALPSLDDFLGGTPTDLTGEFRIDDACSATVANAGTLFQFSSNPTGCMNFAVLLNLILPNDKGNFNMDSPGFMALENIIIRSLSFDRATKAVDIEASYSGELTVIPRVISISNVNLQIKFTSTHSDSWRFDISASITIGSIVIDVSIVRDDEGYFLSATSDDSVTATDIGHMFQTGHDAFLPNTGLEENLKAANLNTFAIAQPRIKAVFTEGYGFLFGGQISILSWDPIDLNLLINKPNDEPLSVTIALYSANFSLPNMFSDLLDMDVSSVPVIGSAQIQNLAIVISTHDVKSPLTVFDIGFAEMFDLPYRKGIKATFDIQIIDVYVTTSILITPNELRLTVSQPGDLTLRKVVNSFLDEEPGLVSNDELSNWPAFIDFDPLAISLSLLDIAATKSGTSGWGMTHFQISLKMTEPITFFEELIRITDLTFDMTWSKTETGSDISGEIAGKVIIGSNENVSPTVDIRIPFPFANQEITFTFTDFSIHSVAAAFGFTIPTNTFELLTQIQLDQIALAFNDAGTLNKLSIQASLPSTWPIFADFSIGNLNFYVEIDNMANSPDRTWLFRLTGHIIISSCDMFISATVGSDEVEITGKGTNCDVSILDLLTLISVNPDILPQLITGFTLSAPVFSFRYDRNSPEKSIGFGATTSLFGSSEAEVAFVSTGGSSAIVAAFAVQTTSAIPELSFLNDLGLTDLAVIYVSQRITMSPYQWGKSIFQTYAPTDEELNSGLTIYARFTPTGDDMMGRLLGEAGQASIVVSLSVPDFVFRLDIQLGTNGIALNGGGRFVSMGLVITKRLVGLNLVFKFPVNENNELTFRGELSFTFGGTVTISLLLDGEWNEPLGIKNFTVFRLGLSLGINVVSLAPSFGLTGEIRVFPHSRPSIDAGLTICVDVANPLSTVFEVHFSRLLLRDIANLFAGKNVNMPDQIGDTGFPDEVRIFVSPSGNENCFGRSYDAGVEISGTFQIPFLQVYASADIKIRTAPTFQLKANLTLRPINYGDGLLKIVSAQSDSIGPYLIMNIGNADEFLINGSCRVVLFGASISIRLEVTKTRLWFQGRLNLWGLFMVDLDVELVYGGPNPSLHVFGRMQNDLFTKIKQRATQGIQRGARAINQRIEGAQAKIRNAQREVESIRGTIRYHQRKINEAKNECRRAPWYRKWVCIRTAARLAYHGVIIGALWVAYGVAKSVLYVANLFLDGVRAAIRVAASVLTALVNALLSIIDIKFITFDILLTATTQSFDFSAEIQILGEWTFYPQFSINFSSRSNAERGINSAGDNLSEKTLEKVE